MVVDDNMDVDVRLQECPVGVLARTRLKPSTEKLVVLVYSLQSCIQTQSKELNICDVFDWSHEFSRSQDMFSEAV